MTFPTPLALLGGLSLRILLSFYTSATFGPVLLTSIWQGVLLYSLYTYIQPAALPAAAGLLLRLVMTLPTDENPVQTGAFTILGGALGTIGTDILSQFLEDGLLFSSGSPQPPAYDDYDDRGSRYHSKSYGSYAASSVSGRSRIFSLQRQPRSRDHHRHVLSATDTPSQTTGHTTSVTSSLPSTTAALDKPNNALEQEAAALRRRAMLADTERRRYREERQWALSEGNYARASQMKVQAKKYDALTRALNREADMRIVEAANTGKPEKAPRENSTRMRTVSIDDGTGRGRRYADDASSGRATGGQTSSPSAARVFIR